MKEKEPRSAGVLGTNRGLLIQSIALLITIVGLAIAADRRVSDNEKATAVQGALLSQQQQTVKDLQTQVVEISKNAVRMATILEQIDRRHLLEDTVKKR